MQASHKILANTGILYIKIFISIIINLYTTRLTLNVLGTEDFGLFSLIGSVIAMLAFLNGAMAISSQRFLSYSFGSADFSILANTFKTAQYLHLVIGLFILFALEFIGPILFNNYLTIPENRLGASNIVFHCVVASTFFTIISVPYDAIINTHENMILVAVITLAETFLKFIVALSLSYINFDKLIFFGMMITGISILSFISKRIYCHNMYKEISYKESKFESTLLKRMLSFTVYNTFSTLSGIAKNSGIAVILNIFFSPIVNAAYGIANQVNGQIMNFSNMMMKAITPQIVKSEGSRDHQRALRLSTSACKISFLLICFFSIPVIINAPFILKLWLINVPENAVLFCQLFLILSMIGQITLPLFHLVQAIGNIRGYQISLGLLQLLNLPIVYILCKIGLPAYFALLSTIFVEAIAGIFRIHFAHKHGSLKVKPFFFHSVFPSIFLVFLSLNYIFIFPSFSSSWTTLLLSSLLSVLFLSVFAWIILFNREEKNFIINLITVIKRKVRFD